MHDDRAAQLAELEVKRNRTLADLEAIQAAAESVHRSMQSYGDRQDALNQHFIARLQRDDLPEPERLAIYREWNAAFQQSIAGFNKLVAEHNRLHVQAVILVRMLAELDFQIEALRSQFG